MAHFAKLDENNNVLAIHVVNNDVILVDGIESEQKGVDFLTSIHGHTNWKQTSYNNNFRNKYAAINDKYDVSLDAFITPQPYPSWLFNNTILKWEPPIQNPSDGKYYAWDETTQKWVEPNNNIH
jgi:hypothetical protein